MGGKLDFSMAHQHQSNKEMYFRGCRFSEKINKKRLQNYDPKNTRVFRKLSWREVCRRQMITLCCLRNGLRTYSLTVVCRKTWKVGCRSNSLCLFVTYTPTHVSIELCIFRCLVGHVFQRCGPVVRNVCRTMVNMSQVMISPDFICKIHIICLTTLHCNERCCNYSHT